MLVRDYVGLIFLGSFENIYLSRKFLCELNSAPASLGIASTQNNVYNFPPNLFIKYFFLSSFAGLTGFEGKEKQRKNQSRKTWCVCVYDNNN